MSTAVHAPFQQLLPQPLVGGTTTLLAVGALAVAWRLLPALPTMVTLVVALALVAATVATYQYPIHVRHRTKLYMTSVPYYLMAVLLPPPLAALCAGVGVFAGEFSVRTQTGALPSDLITHTSRRVLVVLLGALVGHLGMDPTAHGLALIGTGLVLLAGDIVTVPLVLGPLLGERPLPLIVPIARDACLPEGTQYLLGLIGACAAQQYVLTLAVLALPTAMVYLAFKSSKEMHDSTRQLLESMADTVDLRDPYTGGHSRRVTEYCAAILKEMQVTGPETELILSAARVHDIGKIAIPDTVLKKPGPLDPEERALMETHSERGADVLRRYKDFSQGVAIVLHHHESWDGTGYPHRLAGTAIPFGARVMAVADSFDAMTSDRPYRAGMPLPKAVSILRAERGKQWDAQVVDAFLRTVAGQLERPAPPLLRIVPPSMDEASSAQNAVPA